MFDKIPTIGTIIASFFVALAAFVTYLYIFGIPPETKRKIEHAALDAMGETKTSSLVKNTLDKFPDGDGERLKEVKQSISETVGNVVGKSEPGKSAGEEIDAATKVVKSE